MWPFTQSVSPIRYDSWCACSHRVALGINCCKRTISTRSGDVGVGVKLEQSLSSSGTLVCTHVAALHPEQAAAACGVATGDVILEVDGRIVLDCDPTWVAHLIAMAWRRHREVKLVLMPAITARVLTRLHLSSQGGHLHIVCTFFLHLTLCHALCALVCHDPVLAFALDPVCKPK